RGGAGAGRRDLPRTAHADRGRARIRSAPVGCLERVGHRAGDVVLVAQVIRARPRHFGQLRVRGTETGDDAVILAHCLGIVAAVVCGDGGAARQLSRRLGDDVGRRHSRWLQPTLRRRRALNVGAAAFDGVGTDETDLLRGGRLDLNPGRAVVLDDLGGAPHLMAPLEPRADDAWAFVRGGLGRRWGWEDGGTVAGRGVLEVHDLVGLIGRNVGVEEGAADPAGRAFRRADLQPGAAGQVFDDLDDVALVEAVGDVILVRVVAQRTHLGAGLLDDVELSGSLGASGRG